MSSSPSLPPQVVVVGSFVQDLTFTCAEFPQPGETVIGQFLTGPGGKGSNQAVAAARAGARTAFVGAVGRDAFAESARQCHAAEGIDSRLAEKPALATGTAGILVNTRGQNEIIVALAANAALTPTDIDAAGELFDAAAVVVSQLEADLAAAAHALRRARAAGATTVLNPAPMRPDFDLAMLEAVEILIPNETEFTALVNRLPQTAAGPSPFTEKMLAALSPADLHALCRRFGVPTLIVTLGERGCFLSRPGDDHELLPAVRGIRVVDTTGAGDAFVGAFAAALAELGAGEIARAARFANAGAALSVTRPGTAPAMPRRPEIEALLRGQEAGADDAATR